MDTSEKYIKMCEKAEEIQKEWKAKLGDWFIHILSGKEKAFIYIAQNQNANMIWLPRQDQLQEMIEEKPSPGLILKFIKFIGWDGITWTHFNSDWTQFETLGQLWLAFVMKSKFNKTWDDEKEEWVKE